MAVRSRVFSAVANAAGTHTVCAPPADRTALVKTLTVMARSAATTFSVQHKRGTSETYLYRDIPLALSETWVLPVDVVVEDTDTLRVVSGGANLSTYCAGSLLMGDPE